MTPQTIVQAVVTQHGNLFVCESLDPENEARVRGTTVDAVVQIFVDRVLERALEQSFRTHSTVSGEYEFRIRIGGKLETRYEKTIDYMTRRLNGS